MMLLRFTLHGRSTLTRIYADPEEIIFMGAPAIAFLTIVAQAALTCSTARAHGFTILAYVLWWIGMSLIITACTTLYISSAKLRLVPNRTLPSIIFLALVGVTIAATVGGSIANSGYEISPRLAVPMIIVSFLCIAYSTLVTLMVYALYLFELLENVLAYTGEDSWIDSFGES